MRLWQDDEIESLQLLWAEGRSAADIALKLKRSRNSVIGKLHYLDLLGEERFKDQKRGISLGGSVLVGGRARSSS